ncbi:MAG: repair protein recO [Mycobacterium sp.]|nr:repair protein recO [Mycobacterium sp.]MCW2745830.1 repair protein recO [Mycobacterium sp.]
MAVYSDSAVVLRTAKLGEADRIVTLLTRRTGRVRAVAKGVRRTRSKWGARLEPFSIVDCQLFAGRNLDIVTQAVTVRPLGEAIATDYARYTAGTAMLEAAERLTAEEREPATRLFFLLTGALSALADGEHAPGLLLDAFLLRSLEDAGYAMALLDCAGCGEPGPHRALSIPLGGVVCPACRPPGAASPDPAAVRLLWALLHGRWDIADASEGATRREAGGLVTAHLQVQLEQGLRSLGQVDRAAGP